MKRLFFSLVLALVMAAGSFGTVSATPLRFNTIVHDGLGGASTDLARPAASNVLVSRYPYVQSTTTDSTIIAWKTDAPVGSSLEYGLTPAYGLSASGTGETRDHALTLTGLSPQTTYYYRVSANGAALTPGDTFRTAPGPGNAAFSFVAFADSGAGGKYMYQVAGLVDTLDPDLLIHAGDLIYPGGEASNFDPMFFEPYRDVLKNTPFFGVMGNHDVKTGAGKPWLDALHLPDASPGGERYFSFDWGNAHFVGLDVPKDAAVLDEQLAWLANDLSNTNQPWKIVFLHQPPYSSANHGSALQVRASLCRLLEQHGVDLVISGHDHVYERVKPINGVTHIVSGGGGAKLYAAGKSDFTAFSKSVWHVTHVQVEGDTLTLRAIAPGGAVVDTAVLQHGG